MSEQAIYGDTAYYGVELINRSGNGALPLGEHDFAKAIDRCVLVDKTMFIADVLDAGASVVVRCRPEGFGQSMNLSMLKAFWSVPRSDRSIGACLLVPRFGMRVAGTIGMSLPATL